jgi:hypothetical protein
MIPRLIAIYGRLRGWTLARARSGDRIAISAYQGSVRRSTTPPSRLPRPMLIGTSETTKPCKRPQVTDAFWSSLDCDGVTRVSG